MNFTDILARDSCIADIRETMHCVALDDQGLYNSIVVVIYWSCSILSAIYLLQCTHVVSFIFIYDCLVCSTGIPLIVPFYVPEK